VSQRAVSDLERGINRTARKDTALLLADALGLAASGSVTGSGYPSSVPSNAWHTSMMSTTPSRPVSPATGR